MKESHKLLLVSAATLLLTAGDALAVKTSKTSITCSSTAKLQAKIDAVPAGTIGTINVSGVCSENLAVPQGKTIIIVGATPTSRISPANVLLPALVSKGDVTLQKMIVNNSTGSAEALVETDLGGSITLIASDLSAPNVGSVVGAWRGIVRATNSRVVGGTDDALEAWGSGMLTVEGNPAFPPGPTGFFESYVKSTGSGIGCGQGGNVRVQAIAYNSASGSVTLEQSAVGISAGHCSIAIRNKTNVRSNIRIQSNSQGLRYEDVGGDVLNTNIINNSHEGIWLRQSKLNIQSSTLTGNETGLVADQSSVGFDDVDLSNLEADVSGSLMSSLHFYNWNGASSLPKALTWTSSFDCAEGSRIDIDSGALSASLGSQYDFLGCLYSQ